MPILILAIAVVLVFAGINNKLSQLGSLLQQDWQPSGNTPGFGTWLFAIIAVGALGYSKELKPFSNAFLVLIFLGLIIVNKTSFFSQFESAFTYKLPSSTGAAGSNGNGTASGNLGAAIGSIEGTLASANSLGTSVGALLGTTTTTTTTSAAASEISL